MSGCAGAALIFLSGFMLGAAWVVFFAKVTVELPPGVHPRKPTRAPGVEAPKPPPGPAGTSPPGASCDNPAESKVVK